MQPHASTHRWHAFQLLLTSAVKPLRAPRARDLLIHQLAAGDVARSVHFRQLRLLWQKHVKLDTALTGAVSPPLLEKSNCFHRKPGAAEAPTRKRAMRIICIKNLFYLYFNNFIHIEIYHLWPDAISADCKPIRQIQTSLT